MKTILEFDHEEQDKAVIAIKSLEWALVSNEMAEHLRSKVQYGDLSGETQEVLSDMIKHLYETMDRYGVSLDDIE